jgi:hypothetical protein
MNKANKEVVMLTLAEKIKLAKNPLTEPSFLRALERNEKNLKVQILVAKHPNSDFELLDKLSRHNDYSVKAVVAANPNVGNETQARLGGSSEVIVLLNVATNPKTPAFVLEKLIKHKNDVVRDAAKKNLRNNKYIIK